ncbi:MAG: DUF86 domain-containing protein [Deltaproteobacteria bacterium]|nr:DUF86 domain-containing protein [Deltaproteobacteria bacterium]
MVISKLDKERILTGLARLQEYVLTLREFSAMEEDDFLSDKRNPAAVESYLRRALETVFDLGRHILSKTFGVKELESKQIARLLGEKEIVSGPYSETLIRMAGYRNRMVHFYHEITPKELFQIVREQLQDIERFGSEMHTFLKKYDARAKMKER